MIITVRLDNPEIRSLRKCSTGHVCPPGKGLYGRLLQEEGRFSGPGASVQRLSSPRIESAVAYSRFGKLGIKTVEPFGVRMSS